MKLWHGTLLPQRSAKKKPNKISFVYNKSQIRSSFQKADKNDRHKDSLQFKKYICLQPIRSRAANEFAALAFLVWPARRRVLQRAVCHLAARIDNSLSLKVIFEIYFACVSDHFLLKAFLWPDKNREKDCSFENVISLKLIIYEP